MKFNELVSSARDSVSARRVFADPVEKDGVTIIGAAAVGGGGGGGQGQDEKGQQSAGGGFGLGARPVGAYVLKDGTVSWIPAVDVNRLLTILAALLAVFLITRSRIIRARLKDAK
jgi:uncharacterized spore protein YtfJ